MPVLFEEKSKRDSSAENDAPWMAVVSRNCSIVYCLAGRVDVLPALPAGADWDAARVAEARTIAMNRIRTSPSKSA